MNQERRTRAQHLADQLEALRDEIDTLLSKEQEAYDNLPESFQSGERGERMQSAIDQIQQAYDSADEAISALGEAVDA